MKRSVLIVLLVVVAIFAFRSYKFSNGAAARYQAFAEELLHRRYEAAAAMSEGLSASYLEQQGSQERIGGGPAMFQTLFPSRFTIDSQETDGDGTVIIHGTQTVLFNPVGVESVRPAMFATLRQVVKIRKDSSGWKVAAFENTFEKMDSLKKE
jgi:hypothetical protein